MIGLVATANPRPEKQINIANFRARQQYRALASVSIPLTSPTKLSDKIVDPGWTPPLDRSKIDTSVAGLMPLGDDQKFYLGEASCISSIEVGKLHPSTTLVLPKREDRVLVSMLIKFRAGAHTNKMGIEKADSPVHVPWVWCESALIMSNKKYILLGAGSQFPSHAWYINGKRIAVALQKPISLSENEPAISTGRPAGQPRADAMSDRSTGTINSHEFAIPSGAIKVNENISEDLIF